MAKWPIVGIDNNLRSDGEQIFEPFGGVGGSSSEDNTQQEVRDTYTASNLRVYLSTLSTGTVTCRFRVNGADGNQVASASGTGETEDTTNTDSLVSGDLINLDADHDGMHGDSFRLTIYQVTLDASSDVPPFMGAAPWIASSDFVPLMGDAVERAEADIEYTMRATRTLRDLRVFAFAHTTNVVISIRKNRADGNLTVTVTGTGEFLDTSNTDSFVAGDEVNYGSGSGAVSLRVRSVEADTSSIVQMYAGESSPSSLRFFVPTGGNVSAVETETEIEAEANATIQNLFVNCFINAETRTIRTRKNQANGNASVSVTGTGIFEDTVNTDSLAAEDDLSIQQDAGSSGSNGYLVAVEWETAAAPPVGIASMRQLIGHGQGTRAA